MISVNKNSVNTAKLINLLKEISVFFKGLAAESNSRNLANTWSDNAVNIENLLKYYLDNTFKAAIVGGFSRGKSHFVNELLGQEILPESAIPTTACITTLKYGIEPILQICQNGKEESAPLTLENLERFSYDETAALPDIRLNISYPADFLKTGMEIIDTPGVEDINERSSELTSLAIQNADAVIVMLSAVSPLSMTERDFIKVYLLERSVPLIAGCVSFLDQIPQERAANQAAYLAKKCNSLYPKMPLLIPNQSEVLNKLQNSDPQIISGINNIKLFLENWQNNPRLAQLKTDMVKKQALLIVENAISALTAQEKLLAGNIAQTKEEINQAIAQLNDNSDVCGKLKTEFMEHRDKLQTYIRQTVTEFGEHCLEHIEEGAPVESVISEQANELYDSLLTRVNADLHKDINYLSGELARLYGTPAQMALAKNITFRNMPVTKINPKGQGYEPVIDEVIKRAMKFLDIYVMRFPGANIVWALARPYVAALLGKTKNYLPGDLNKNKALQKDINDMCAGIDAGLRKDIRDIYEHIFDEVKKIRVNWLEDQKLALQNSRDLKNLQKLKEYNNQQLIRSLHFKETLIKEFPCRLAKASMPQAAHEENLFSC